MEYAGELREEPATVRICHEAVENMPGTPQTHNVGGAIPPCPVVLHLNFKGPISGTPLTLLHTSSTPFQPRFETIFHVDQLHASRRTAVNIQLVIYRSQ